MVVDVCDLSAVQAALAPETKLIVAETIANPLLRVPDIAALSTLARSSGARLLIDNTFASPAICRPLALGADLVMESLTKIMSGHSDVCLGVICGSEKSWQRVPSVLSTWGLASSPFDCWMAGAGWERWLCALSAPRVMHWPPRVTWLISRRSPRRIIRVSNRTLTMRLRRANSQARSARLLRSRCPAAAPQRIASFAPRSDSLRSVVGRPEQYAVASGSHEPSGPDRRGTRGTRYHRRHDSPIAGNRVERRGAGGAGRRISRGLIVVQATPEKDYASNRLLPAEGIMVELA